MRRTDFYSPEALRHRLTLYRPVETANGTGGLSLDYEHVAAVWAAMEPLKSRSFLEAQQDQEETVFRITLRFRDDISAGWQFRKTTRLFHIDDLYDPDERGVFLQCTCREEGR